MKCKYEAIKKELKQRHAKQISYAKGTGGGPYIPPPPPENEDEKLLADTIAISIQGLSSEFDSDGLAGKLFLNNILLTVFTFRFLGFDTNIHF